MFQVGYLQNLPNKLAFSESIRELEREPLNVLQTLRVPVEAQKGFVWVVVPVDEQGRVGKAVWSKEGEVSSEFMKLAKQKIASFKRFKPKWAYAHTLAGYQEKLLKVQQLILMGLNDGTIIRILNRI